MDIVSKPISSLFELFQIFWNAMGDIINWLLTPINVPPFSDDTPIELILGYGVVAVLTYTIITWILNIIT